MHHFIEAARKLKLFKRESQREAAQDYLELVEHRADPNFEAESRRFLTRAVGKGKFFGLFKTKEQRATEEYLKLLRNEVMKDRGGREKDAIQRLNYDLEHHPKARPIKFNSPIAKSMIDGLYKDGGHLKHLSRSADQISIKWLDKTGNSKEKILFMNSPIKEQASAAQEFWKLMDGQWKVTAADLGYEHMPVHELLAGIHGKGGIVDGIGRAGDEIHLHWRTGHGKKLDARYSLSDKSLSARLMAQELSEILGHDDSVKGSELGLYETPKKLADHIWQKYDVSVLDGHNPTSSNTKVILTGNAARKSSWWASLFSGLRKR